MCPRTCAPCARAMIKSSKCGFNSLLISLAATGKHEIMG